MFDNQTLTAGLAERKIPRTERSLSLFKTYHRLLLEWNQRVNLISKKDEYRIVSRHFLDSLNPLTVMTLGPGLDVLDAGSGAGFPGLPLKIVRPDLKVSLVESRRPRYLFLLKLVGELGLRDVLVFHARIESLGEAHEMFECFDLILNRAVAPLSQLMGWEFPLLKPGGRMVCWKGPEAVQEARTLKKKGVVGVHLHRVSGGSSGAGSILMVVEKAPVPSL